MPEYRLTKALESGRDDLALERQLAAVSRLLDRKLNQPYGFNVDATVTTRIYGPGDNIAPIASLIGLIVKAATGTPIDWSSVTALTINEDFETLPYGALSGPEPAPITALRLVGWGAQPPSVWTPKTYIPDDFKVQVTALHGWPAVPEAIKEATIQLTAILRAESPFATDRIQELDQAVGTSGQARAILKALYEVYNAMPVAIG